MSTQIPDIKEKVGAAVAYLTLGIWGLVWLLISRTTFYDQKSFIRFHCLQSIFIGMLFMFIPQGLSILFSLIIQIISFIPVLNSVSSMLHSIHGLIQTVVQIASLGLIIYCVVISLYGKYTNIPWVSQSINRMLR